MKSCLPGGLLSVAFVLGLHTATAASLLSEASVLDLSTSDSCSDATSLPGVTVAADCSAGGLAGSARSFVTYGSAGAFASLHGSNGGLALAEGFARWTDLYLLPAGAEFASYTFTVDGATTNNGLDVVLGQISLFGAFSGVLFETDVFGDAIVTTPLIAADIVRDADVSVIFRSQALLLSATGATVAGQADFLGGFRLTSINVFDVNRQPITGVVAGESGTVYPTSDATAIPEPASINFLVIGLFMCFGRLSVCRRSS